MKIYRLFLYYMLLLPEGVIAQAVTYLEHIQPILSRRCMPCHQNDNIGAMPLTNYSEVKSFAKMIGYVTKNRIMPPNLSEGGMNILTENNALSADELKMIQQWVSSGNPMGKQIDSLNDKPFQSIHIQEPDTCIGVSQSFYHKGDFVERTQVFVIPLQWKEDRYVDSIEFVPGNTRIVKSCFISVDTGRQALIFDNNDQNSGYSSFVIPGFVPSAYNWSYWQPRRTTDVSPFPYVKKLPANGILMMQINYKAVGEAESDSSFIKFTFKKRTPETKVMESSFFFMETDIKNGPLEIKRDSKKRFYAERKISRPVTIIGFAPQAHFSCQQWDIYAIDSASGQRFEWLHIPQWNTHWREKYILEQPVTLSAGSVIYATAFYNNSEENSNLINIPSQKIISGKGSRNELFFISFDTAVPDNPASHD